jgi:hypothetical protein
VKAHLPRRPSARRTNCRSRRSRQPRRRPDGESWDASDRRKRAR